MGFGWLRRRTGRPARALALGAGLVLGLTLLSADLATAEKRRHRAPGELVSRHAERLGLDAATQAELAQILEESGAQYRELKEEKRAAREDLRALLSAPEPDREAILAQADVVDALRSRAHHSKLDAILRIHELLTPDQRAALVAIRNEERPWRRGRGPLGRCSADLRAICADVPDGPDALRCLADHWDRVSDACREAVEESRHEPHEPAASETSEPGAAEAPAAE